MALFRFPNVVSFSFQFWCEFAPLYILIVIGYFGLRYLFGNFLPTRKLPPKHDTHPPLPKPMALSPTRGDEAPVLAKLLFIGDAGVGKSSLLRVLAGDGFTDYYGGGTIGVDFRITRFQKGNSTIKFQLWDTAGQERFRSITRAYFRGSHVVLLCFSNTCAPSCESLKRWMEQALQAFVPEFHGLSYTEFRERILRGPPPPSPFPFFVFVGCKDDLPREITPRQLDEFEEAGYPIVFTSAKTGAGCMELMDLIMQRFMIENTEIFPTAKRDLDATCRRL